MVSWMKISFPTLHVLAVKCQQFEQTAMLHSAEEELKNTTSLSMVRHAIKTKRMRNTRLTERSNMLYFNIQK